MQLERDVESHLKKSVKRMGGRCIKLSSQHEEGLPDRMVMLPGGKVFFVELKRLGGVLSPMQRVQHKSFKKLGFKVYVPYTKEEIDDLLREEVMPNEIQTT